jgi:phosphoglycerol transferase MdoB-like AlkP superfamily enzyme
MFKKIVKAKKINEIVEKGITFLSQKKQQLTQQLKRLAANPIKQILVFSVLVYFLLEMLSSRSVIEGLLSVIQNPIMFIHNVLLIMLTMSVANFVSKRNFMVFLLATIWLGLGFGNFLLLGYRITPLTAADIGILKSVFDIIQVYMNVFQIALVVLLTLGVVLLIGYSFIKIKKTKVQYKQAIIVFCCTLALLTGVNNLAYRANALTDNFTNIAQAFQDYGFAYCFSISLIDRGIDEPKSYSEAVIYEVLDEIHYPIKAPGRPKKEILYLSDNDLNTYLLESTAKEVETEDVPVSKPNIVMVQLESFFDVRYLKNYNYSQNPTPNFSQLKKDFSTGFLTVPSIGAGTANTEFEVLSGMSLNFFGAGEYPYKTILKEKAVESIAYNLDALGYYNHAIHNNTGTFYSRHNVYANLGFDSYSSLEYMKDIEFNPLGWAKDKIITTEVMKALKASDEQDFVFAVSVQPHGKYPSTIVDESQQITMTADIDEEKRIAYEYFINQLYETDQFIGELTEALSNYPEPVVLVLYGDHLPTMGIEDVDLVNANKFQTEYVLWSNYPLTKVDKDLMSYQLNSYVMERLGYDNGVLNKFHQMNAEAQDYLETFLLLQYDMLYGENTVYGGLSPFYRKDMKMGIDSILLTSVTKRGETIFVTGDNFTNASGVYIDNELKETWFIDEHTLVVPMEELDVYQHIYIAQLTPKGFKLSKTEEKQLIELITN